MIKALEPYTLCRPASEAEHRAILDLGRSLGFSIPNEKPFATHPFIWMPWTGSICPCLERSYTTTRTIPVPEFIAGMYNSPSLQERLSDQHREDVLKKIREQVGELVALEVKRSKGACRVLDMERLINNGVYRTKPAPIRDTMSGIVSEKAVFDSVGNKSASLNDCVLIDSSTSPQGIPFEVALAYMRAGREIKMAHPSWRGEKAWSLDDNEDAILKDCMEDEWDVVPRS